MVGITIFGDGDALLEIELRIMKEQVRVFGKEVGHFDCPI